jgi:hypothetical protein
LISQDGDTGKMFDTAPDVGQKVNAVQALETTAAHCSGGYPYTSLFFETEKKTNRAI